MIKCAAVIPLYLRNVLTGSRFPSGMQLPWIGVDGHH